MRTVSSVVSVLPSTSKRPSPSAALFRPSRLVMNWTFLGTQQVATRRVRASSPRVKPPSSSSNRSDNGGGEDEDIALSAIEKLMNSEKGEKLSKGRCEFLQPSPSSINACSVHFQLIFFFSSSCVLLFSVALDDVASLRAAKKALEESSSPTDEVERQRIQKLRAESLEQLQERLEEVEDAKKELGKCPNPLLHLLLPPECLICHLFRCLSLPLPSDNVNAQQEDLRILLQQDEERIESVKCAVVGAVVGGAVSLPVLLLNPDILSLASATISSALFALTYRYSVSNDVQNTQLKSGCVLAFGLTRGLANLHMGEPIFSNVSSTFQSLLLFGFVSAALEFGFSNGQLNYFRNNK